MELDAVRRVLTDLPLRDPSARRSLGGLLVRFHAERST
jgi:hypothetical protein